jgi:hypothetical protein
MTLTATTSADKEDDGCPWEFSIDMTLDAIWTLRHAAFDAELVLCRCQACKQYVGAMNERADKFEKLVQALREKGDATDDEEVHIDIMCEADAIRRLVYYGIATCSTTMHN